jgi:hypothetical protein
MIWAIEMTTKHNEMTSKVFILGEMKVEREAEIFLLSFSVAW